MPSRQHEDLVAGLKAKLETARGQSQEAQQAAFAEFAVTLFPQLPADVVWKADTLGGVPIEWIDVPESDPHRIVFYLHGGGYNQGSPATHRELAARIGRAAQARVVSVDYRLAPANPFPAALDDSLGAYRALIRSGVSPRQVAVVGDSAGGGLGVATLLALRDAHEALPAAAVGLSPWLDLEGTGPGAATIDDPIIDIEHMRWTGKQYGGEQLRHPLVSPVHADFRGLPPILFQVGTRELLLDDSRRGAETAKAAGVDVTLEEWDGLIHVWPIWGDRLPEATQAVANVGAFIRKWIPTK